MLMIICIAMLALYLASIPIRTRARGSFELPDGKGEIKLSVFYIPVFKAQGRWETSEPGEGDIIFLFKKHKQKMHVDVKKSPREIIRAIRKLDLSIIGNLDVKNIDLKLHYGSKDAFMTMAVLSSARILFYSAMSALKSNQSVEISEEFLPLYNNPALKLEFCGIFCLSIADIIYGYAVGKLRRLRRQFSEYLARRQQKKSEKQLRKGKKQFLKSRAKNSKAA